MITADDIKSYINTAASDFTQLDIDLAIAIALKRYSELTSVEADDSDPVVKKALILLAISELANQVNLYWRGENTELIRSKDLAVEVERLLKLKIEKIPIRFVQL